MFPNSSVLRSTNTPRSRYRGLKQIAWFYNNLKIKALPFMIIYISKYYPHTYYNLQIVPKHISMETLQCSHVHHPTKNYCLLCGTYLLNSLISGIKTSRFFEPCATLHSPQLSEIQNMLFSFKQLEIASFDKESMHQLANIVERNNWSLRTQVKGMYFFFHYSTRYPKLQPDLQFKYAAMCMYVAVKFQEHTNGKSLRRFRRECDKCFSMEEFYILEANILESIDWDFNIPTFIDLIEFYLTRGVVFSNERQNPKKVQDKVISLCKVYLRNGMFLRINQQKLAAFIVYKARLQAQCPEVWNWSIEEYSKISVQKVKQAFQQIRDMLLGVKKISFRSKSLLQCLAPTTPRTVLKELQNFIF